MKTGKNLIAVFLNNHPYRWISPILFLLPVIIGAPSAFSQTGKAATWNIKQITDFELNGDTLGQVWKNIPWVNLSLRDTGKSSYQTRVKLTYSSKGLYALYWCEDKKITATMQHDFDNIFTEDVVEIFLWTDESQPIYFEYELSPLNKELAILVPNTNGSFYGWRPWHYEGERLTRHKAQVIQEGNAVKGWVAEFFIPYTLLKPLQNVPPKPGTQWRINVYRIDYDGGAAHWWWQPVKPNFHDFKNYGTLQFE